MPRRLAAIFVMILLGCGLAAPTARCLRNLWHSARLDYTRSASFTDEASAARYVDGGLYDFLERVKNRLGEGTPLSLVLHPDHSPAGLPGDLALVYQRTWFYLLPHTPPGESDWRVIPREMARGGESVVDSSGVIPLDSGGIELVLVRRTRSES